jgi:tight adherence protein C
MGSAELFLGGGLLLAAYSVYSFVASIFNSSADKESLSWAMEKEPVKSKSGLMNMSKPLVHNFTLKHAVKIKAPGYRKKIEKLILTAGMRKEMTVDEFIGVQILWGLMIPVFVQVMNFALSMGYSPVMLLLMMPFGYQLPHMHASSEKTKRGNSARKDLPFFSDLLALSTEAGLDFVGAIQRIVEKAPADNVLANELGEVLKDIKVGATRADAMKGLAKRLEINEIISFVAVIVDADATGTSISKVLKEQSTQIRLERFVRAEKAGAKASQMILLPMIMFIMPAVFLVVFGPVVIGFISGSK